MPVFYGSPAPLDEFLRPFIRGIQWTVGAIVTFIAWWLAPMWAWPLPALLVLIAAESILWLRGNRIYQLHLSSEEVRFFRGSKEPEITLKTNEIETFNLLYSENGPRRNSVVCVLRTATDVVGFQLETEGQVSWQDQDIPVNMMVALFGGNPALLRGMVKREGIIGQVIRDPRGEALNWLREHLREQTGDTQSARVWRGLEPPLDPFGFHANQPDGLMRTGRKQWTTPNGFIEIRPQLCGIAHRSIPGQDELLPVMVIQINDSQSFCFPAPALPGWCTTETPLTPGSYHTHLAEGVALLWAYLRTAKTLPPELSEALVDISNLMGPLPQVLERHIKGDFAKSHSEVASDPH